MALTTLAKIRTKVRRLTRSPSATMLSDNDIDEYINTFLLYDLPESIRLDTLVDNFVFYTEPDVDTYGTDVIDPNIYINTDKPIYIAGRRVYFSQSQEEFYDLYPKINSISTIGTNGDGVTVAFTGTLSSKPILKNNVTFTSIDSLNDGLELHDDGAGILSGDGVGTINYLTGAYTLTFSAAPGDGKNIDSQTVPYVASVPQTILYFTNEMVMRPVPDKPYRVEIQVYKQPTELLLDGSSPELKQWSQYIAYGAAKKVFEDRTDIESAAAIMPEFKQQERFALRRTLMQQQKDRAPTIFTEQASTNNWWSSPRF